MAHTLKQSNAHKPHPTECEKCGRALPKQAHRSQCAGCIKQEASR
jgi:Zn finger protein HypA/HybF involved in hydrogenase expression